MEQINRSFQDASEGFLKGILQCSFDPCVSIDFCGSLFSAIVDLSLTQVVSSDLVKVLAWYDNESGFSARMLDLAEWLWNKK